MTAEEVEKKDERTKAKKEDEAPKKKVMKMKPSDPEVKKTPSKKKTMKVTAPKKEEEEKPEEKKTPAKKTMKVKEPPKEEEIEEEEGEEEEAEDEEDLDEEEEEEEVEIVEEKEEYRVKIKPDLSVELKSSLKTREYKKSKSPVFRRQEWFRYKRLGTAWRRPKGKHSKMRRHKGYRPNVVSIGYGGPSKTKNLHPSGFKEIMVYNVNDLEKIDPKTEAARIGHSVGVRKRIEIGEKADELGIRVLNWRP
jgi:large subunit ribosomal protein L32e